MHKHFFNFFPAKQVFSVMLCVCVDLKYDVCYEYIYIFYYLKKTPVPAQYINVWWFRATWAALCFTIGATRKGH